MRNSRRVAKDVYEQMHRNGHKPNVFSARALLSEELPPVRWAVEGILPAGVTLFGGKPKMGKSWMALGLALAVATGGRALGKVPVEKGTALYLALEDNKRRLQKRIRKLLAGEDAPEGLELTTEWPRLDDGGLEALETWLEDNPATRLLVIDTLKKIRPRGSGNRGIYDVDYEALEPLLPLADRYDVAMLIVHHLRLLPAADPLDELSGSTGLSGGVDGALILRRQRGSADAALHVTGRDVEDEAEYALEWDHNLAAWTLMGDAEEFRMAENPRKIVQAINDAGKALSPKEISTLTGIDNNTVRNALWRMVEDGSILNPSRGQYTTANIANNANIAFFAHDANNEKKGSESEPHLVVVSSDENAANNEKPIDKPNKANVSNVSVVSEASDPLDTFFADPPEWFVDQAAKIPANLPDRLVKPLVSSTTYEVYGGMHKLEEVRPRVLSYLKSGGEA